MTWLGSQKKVRSYGVDSTKESAENKGNKGYKMKTMMNTHNQQLGGRVKYLKRTARRREARQGYLGRIEKVFDP